jgi:hypothetical protein
MIWRIRNFFKSVARLWVWLPVIWRDRDYDYGFLLTLIDFKLSRMKPVIGSGYSVHAQDYALQIEKARLLIRNIHEDPDDEFSAHYDQWDGLGDNYEECDAHEEHSAALVASMKRDRRNWHALWKHFNKYMRGWWD